MKKEELAMRARSLLYYSFLALLGWLVFSVITQLILPSSRMAGENLVINNLRQISGAKDQLAMEKRLEPGHVIRHQDLAPYLKNGSVPQFGTERYVLNPIGTEPYAVLESDWYRGRRPFSRRLEGTNGTVYRLPSLD